MSWWQPDIFQHKLPRLRTRQRMVQATRAWFHAQGFDEVETPALQICPGMEVHLHAFETRYVGPNPADVHTFYLHTSPELTMKKLLVAGMQKIYQLAHVWRNGENAARHSPEFTMLEWYRAGADYTQLRDDCTHLVRAIATTLGTQNILSGDQACDLFGDWEVLTVPEAFQRYAGIDVMATIDDRHHPSPQALAAAARAQNIRVADDDDWDSIFFRIMFDKIEPHLGRRHPTFLTDYPVHMAALARPKPDDDRLAERFELYMHGIELANAFGELTDVAEQERRLKADQATKQRLYGQTYPVDDDFLQALRHGMPPSAGIALGFDRLAMLFSGTDNIQNVLWAPVAINQQ